jgi:hypothetical protein
MGHPHRINGSPTDLTYRRNHLGWLRPIPLPGRQPVIVATARSRLATPTQSLMMPSAGGSEIAESWHEVDDAQVGEFVVGAGNR